MKVGVHDLSNHEYHNGLGLSSSGIKELLKSAAHYKQYLAERTEPTTEMIKGTLVHALILEPEKFEADFVVGSFSVRRGKEYEKILASAGTKHVVTEDEVIEAKKIAESVLKQAEENPRLKELLQGVKEKSFVWHDKKTKVLCKVRPDCIANDGATVVDLKTTRDAGKDYFLKQVVDFAYFLSAAYYLRGLRETLKAVGEGPKQIKTLPKEFVFVAIETKPPYQVQIYKASQTMLDFGDYLIDKALDRLAECICTDVWEGYSKAVCELELPNWAYTKYDKEKR